MLFVGGLAAIVLIALEMRRTGERPEEIYPLLLLLMVSTVFGARILYCIDFQEQHAYGLLDVLEFWKGGLALHGGAILAFVAYTLYTSWRRLDFWGTADLLTPPAAMFIFFARIGCFLTGCCYGKQCDPDFPLALTFTNHAAIAPKNEALYPTQLAFAAAALLVFVVVWVRRKRQRFQGEVTLVGVSLFSLLAFVIEFFRADLRVLYEIGGVTLSQNQVMNALIFLASSHLYIYRRRETGGRPG
jgi:phosphatidylglycerol:prolipoprotein diacylglycerol transferase